MTANAPRKHGKKGEARGAGGASRQSEGTSLPAARPLKPRPRLFVALSVLFGLWVAFLLTLYFTTIPARRSTVPGYDAQGTIEGTIPSAR